MLDCLDSNDNGRRHGNEGELSLPETTTTGRTERHLRSSTGTNYPEGVQAISRGLSAAIPPVQFSKMICTPKGCQQKDLRDVDIPQLHYHLVFSTKRREPRIAESWMARLHEYLGGTVTGLGGIPQGVGGVADHVHLLVGLKATHCLSDFMRELKKASSAWVHDTIGEKTFGWQEGYSAFTVSATSRSGVQSYIANQAAHHRQKGLRDELIELLQRAEVEFDQRFLD